MVKYFRKSSVETLILGQSNTTEKVENEIRIVKDKWIPLGCNKFMWYSCGIVKISPPNCQTQICGICLIKSPLFTTICNVKYTSLLYLLLIDSNSASQLWHWALSVGYGKWCLGPLVARRSWRRRNTEKNDDVITWKCFLHYSPLRWKSIGHRFPSQIASSAELWCFGSIFDETSYVKILQSLEPTELFKLPIKIFFFKGYSFE